MVSAVNDRLYLMQNVDEKKVLKSFRFFRPACAVGYQPFCDDFGPMNMSCIVDFIKCLDYEFSTFPESKIAFCVEKGRRNLTNAVFLLGAYMILREGLTPQAVAASFDRLDDELLEAYRDATHSKPDFRLRLIDCWRGLDKGIQQGWIRLAASAAKQWGQINMDEYRYFDNPFHGDLHEVLPGKFVAFKGPVDAGSFRYRDSASGMRTFSPSYYAEIFKDMGVSTVVRLNEPRYDSKAFTSQGFEHYDLEFEDCTCPPDDVITAFFRIADAAPGAIAVHCHAGLGRTGTLIGLYLMRKYEFTAREAMGWLRIMRPGSVIGEQQRYLCDVEKIMCNARASGVADDDVDDTLRRGDGEEPRAGQRRQTLQRSKSEPDVTALAAAAPRRGGAAAARPADLAAQVKAGMLRRSASFGRLV